MKKDFLEEIEQKYEIKRRIFGENEKYTLIGFPFYTESRKSLFIRI